MLEKGALEEVKKIHDLILIDHSQLQKSWSKVVVKLFG